MNKLNVSQKNNLNLRGNDSGNSGLQVPKYQVDLKPLNYNLAVDERLKIFKNNNEFLFKETKEEKDLKEKINSLTLTPNQILNE